VLVITGHGLKTAAALGEPQFAAVLDGGLDEFEAFWAGHAAGAPLPSRSEA
jgi:hypothetical protein